MNKIQRFLIDLAVVFVLYGLMLGSAYLYNYYHPEVEQRAYSIVIVNGNPSLTHDGIMEVDSLLYHNSNFLTVYQEGIGSDIKADYIKIIKN